MKTSIKSGSFVTLLVAACFCVVWPRTSAAGPITLLVSNCAGGAGTILTGSGSLMLDMPCSSTDTGGVGFGDAAAKADMTHGLQLGARASGTSSTTAPLSFDGEVRIADTITLVGGTVGTSGFLQLVFAVDGSCFDAVQHCSIADFSSGLEEEVFLSANSVNAVSASFPVGTATLAVPFTFGLASSLNLQLSTDVAFNQFGAPGSEGVSLSEDFFNTATLTSFAVLDGNMQPVAGGSVDSVDGLFQAQAVPEPASLVLLGSGITVAVSRRRRA